MHELAITQGIVEMIIERTDSARVTAVYLRIGKVSGVVPEAVRFCFDLVAAGSPVEGARLEIDEPPGRARCRSCGDAFAVDGLERVPRILRAGCGRPGGCCIDTI